MFFKYFKASRQFLIFKDFSKQSCIFKYFSSLCEPCNNWFILVLVSVLCSHSVFFLCFFFFFGGGGGGGFGSLRLSQ